MRERLASRGESSRARDNGTQRRSDLESSEAIHHQRGQFHTKRDRLRSISYRKWRSFLAMKPALHSLAHDAQHIPAAHIARATNNGIAPSGTNSTSPPYLMVVDGPSRPCSISPHPRVDRLVSKSKLFLVDIRPKPRHGWRSLMNRFLVSAEIWSSLGLKGQPLKQ